MLLPAAAFAVHQLRYELGYGSRSGAALAAQGHGYQNSLAPWVVLLLAVAPRDRSSPASRAPRPAAPRRRRRSFAALFGFAWALLLAVYCAAGVARGRVRGRPSRRAWPASSATAAGGRYRCRPAAAAVVALLLLVGAAVVEVVARLAHAASSRASSACSSGLSSSFRFGSRRSRDAWRVGLRRPSDGFASSPVPVPKGVLLKLRACARARHRCARAARNGSRPRTRPRRSPSTTASSSTPSRWRAARVPVQRARRRPRRCGVRTTKSEPVRRFAGRCRSRCSVSSGAGSGSTRARRPPRRTGSLPRGRTGWIKVSGGSLVRVARPPAVAAAAEHSRAASVRSRCRSRSTGGRRRSRVSSSASRGPPSGRGRSRPRSSPRGSARRDAGAGARAALTVGLGVAAALAALVEVTTFAVRDAPTGGVAWLQVSRRSSSRRCSACCSLRLHGRARVHAAGVVGAVAAAVSLSSLPVFWHGVVISALPATAARAACALAIALRASRRRCSASCPSSTSPCG